MLNIFLKFLVMLSVMGVVIFPADVINQGKIAVEIAFFRVIPSLFPFFVLQSLIVSMGISQAISNTLGIIFNKIFKVSNSSPYILGIIGGYPLGFKSVIELYNQNVISKTEAEKIVGYCNNAGPAFVIGYIGTFLFDSQKIGYILLFSHIFSSFLIGIVLRETFFEKKNYSINKQKQKPFYENFIFAVNSSFSAILVICGYIIFFNIFAEILINFNVFSSLSFLFSPVLDFFKISTNDFTAVLIGMIEMTSGINYLQNSSEEFKIIASSFLLAFSGISIHFQTLSFNDGLNLKTYYISKFLQCICSPIFSFLIYKQCI